MAEEALAAPEAPEAPAAPPQAPAAAAAEGDTAVAQNTAEQAPATAPEGEKPATDQDPEKKRESRRFERRLDKAYRKAAEATARAEFLEKQLNELRAKATPADSADPAAPKLEHFDDIEKYAAARAKYEADKAVKDYQTRQQGETQKQAQARLVQEWETKAERGGGKYDDFDEVVGDIKPTAPWSMALMEAENGDEIAYYLGKNIKEAQRIASLPPVSQIREIGRLEAKLAAEPQKPKTPSRAPAPITPLTGAAPVVSDVPSDQDDTGAWIKKRSKQVHGNRFGSR
jgi:hypothetical protein